MRFHSYFYFYKSAALQRITKTIVQQRTEFYISLRRLQTLLCMPFASRRPDLPTHVPAGHSKMRSPCHFLSLFFFLQVGRATAHHQNAVVESELNLHQHMALRRLETFLSMPFASHMSVFTSYTSYIFIYIAFIFNSPNNTYISIET